MTRTLIPIALFTAFFVTPSAPATAADKLIDVLREAKWDGIIGTWVDPETKGRRHQTTYEWKIQDRVIEITTKQGNKQQVALMGVNGKTGDVFHMGADSDGGSTIGKWEIGKDGDAVLGVAFTAGDGNVGAFKIRHHLENKDSMAVTLELARPITFKMVRQTPSR